MSDYHQPHETASLLGLTPATLRRWCEYHKDYLSPDTQPSAGQSRRFTNRDIEVLRHCKHLRAQGLTVTSINEQLAGLTFPEVDTDEQDTSAPPGEAITAPPAQQDGQGAALALQPSYTAIERVEARLDRLERSREPALIIGIGIGFIGALLFVIVILIVAVLYGGFR